MRPLLEITLSTLHNKTTTAFPDKPSREKKVGVIGVTNIKYVPFEKTKELKVEASVTSGSSKYNCSMRFSGVKYESESTANNITITGADNSDYNVKKISPNQNDVRVHCSCLDFYYRFAQANYQNDGLDSAPPPPYVKKTDRPPVNPTNSPGICKHLMKMQEQLEVVGLLK